MIPLAETLTEILAAWPLAFLIGVLVGLLAASRYRIIRLRNGGRSDAS